MKPTNLIWHNIKMLKKKFKSLDFIFIFYFEETIILIRTHKHESSIYSFLKKLIKYMRWIQVTSSITL